MQGVLPGSRRTAKGGTTPSSPSAPRQPWPWPPSPCPCCPDEYWFVKSNFTWFLFWRRFYEWWQKENYRGFCRLCLKSRLSMTVFQDYFILILLCRHPPSARREEPSRVVVHYVVVSSVILLVLFIGVLLDLTWYIVRTWCSELFFLKLKTEKCNCNCLHKT